MEKMNCWILQCNPNKWCWFDAVRDYGNKPDTWGISQYVNEVKLSDTAFVWLSNEYEPKTQMIYNPQIKRFEKLLDKHERTSKVIRPRGIYAMAKITGVPDEQRKRFDWEYQYRVDKEEMERLSSLPRLELKYTKFLIDTPLVVDDLKAANLNGLLILRMPHEGIYNLTPQECEIIKSLIGNR